MSAKRTGTHAEFQEWVAKCLDVDPSRVAFSFTKPGFKRDFKIISIFFLTDGAPAEDHNPLPERAAIVPEPWPPVGTGVLAFVLETVTCRYFTYTDPEERFCNVWFRYKRYGLERKQRKHKWSDGEGNHRSAVVSWFENPIRGQPLEGPMTYEIFPGKKHGDLFLNWVEYPARCQVWRFVPSCWSESGNFEIAHWERVSWGFQNEGLFLVILPYRGTYSPALVPKDVYFDKFHTDNLRAVIM